MKNNNPFWKDILFVFVGGIFTLVAAIITGILSPSTVVNVAQGFVDISITPQTQIVEITTTPSDTVEPQIIEVEVTREIEVTRLVEAVTESESESKESGSSNTLTEGTWEGTLTQGARTYSLFIHVERVSGSNFFGKVHIPDINNSIKLIEGRILSEAEVKDIVEESKWIYVDGFNSDTPQVWLLFNYTSSVQGSGLYPNATYRGLLEENGEIIRGAWFQTGEDSSADGYFTSFRE